MNNKVLGVVEILLIGVIIAGLLILCKPLISRAANYQFMQNSVEQLTEW